MSDHASATTTAPAATLGGATPIFRVADVEVSLAYYVERLGFAVEWRDGGVASVRRGDAALMLCADDQGHAGTWAWIATSDVDRLYAELAERGARLRHPPTNYPWGSRECQVTDPDGHVLRFGADLRADEPMGEWRDGDGRRWAPLPDGRWRASD